MNNETLYPDPAGSLLSAALLHTAPEGATLKTLAGPHSI